MMIAKTRAAALIIFCSAVTSTFVHAQQRKLTSPEQGAVDEAVSATLHWTEVFPCPELMWDTVSTTVWPGELRMDPGLNVGNEGGMRTFAEEVKPDGSHVFKPESGNSIGISTNLITGGEFEFGCSDEINQLLGGGLLYSETAHQDLACELGKNGLGKTPADQEKFLESELEAYDRLDRFLGWLLSSAGELMAPGDAQKIATQRDKVQAEKEKIKTVLEMF